MGANFPCLIPNQERSQLQPLEKLVLVIRQHKLYLTGRSVTPLNCWQYTLRLGYSVGIRYPNAFEYLTHGYLCIV